MIRRSIPGRGGTEAVGRIAGPSAICTGLIGLALVATAVLVVWVQRADANAGAQGTCGYQNGTSGPTGSNCVRLANNRWHAVRYAGLGNGNGWTDIDTALTWVIDNRLDVTDMVAYVTSTDDLPDVWAMDNTYPAIGFFAWVDCPANNTGTGGTGALRWCRGQYLRFNSYWEADWNGTNRELACHELGHTVGLRHNDHTGELDNSCMRAPTNNNLPNDFYSPHERVDHINANY